MKWFAFSALINLHPAKCALLNDLILPTTLNQMSQQYFVKDLTATLFFGMVLNRLHLIK
jgi:hypothetical protein